ncbi:carbon-phosphorus lyase complex subunit PhnI [Nocardia sp. NPDC059239]|uniref:carbon-phosphorus lyase complex subunit PhnI n=1 Tax=Nocardia sp. NPDC059239 TaxID=3346785 RepID=UPI00369457EA
MTAFSPKPALTGSQDHPQLSDRSDVRAVMWAEQLKHAQLDGSTSTPLQNEQITERLGQAVDRAMAEGAIWAPTLAARAVRQAEGDSIEAAHLLRAHRLRLPRLAVTEPTSTDEMRLLRRIVPTQQGPDSGPQRLGASDDFSARLLDTSAVPTTAALSQDEQPDNRTTEEGAITAPIPRLTDLLRELDLLAGKERTESDLPARGVRSDPPMRSFRRTLMARADSTAIVAMAYQTTYVGDHAADYPTLSELRYGRLPLAVAHGTTGGRVVIGTIPVTEAEVVADLDGPDHDERYFDAGYGACLGHLETKAIAIALLDLAVEQKGPGSPLAHAVEHGLDGLDAAGLLASLKLPRYVSFQAKLERKLATRTPRSDATTNTTEGGYAS